jgi:predicted DNA-binding WGR domain protein
MKMTMIRSVKGRVRYYTLELIPNLFGEWMVVRTYGSIKKLKPTGVIREIYDNAEAAAESMQLLISAKLKKGYTNRCTLNNG